MVANCDCKDFKETHGANSNKEARRTRDDVLSADGNDDIMLVNHSNAYLIH